MYGFLCEHKFIFLRGKYLEVGNCIVNFIREIAKLFVKWLNHSHQGCMRVPAAPHSHQHLALFVPVF